LGTYLYRLRIDTKGIICSDITYYERKIRNWDDYVWGVLSFDIRG